MTRLTADLRTSTGRYAAMLATRKVEERIGALFTEGIVRGTAHLAVGQEACAVGAVGAADSGDPIVSSHRGHGHFLARTLDPALLFGELLGKASGPCMGRGGSQHLCRLQDAFYGTNGITGGGIPVATGIALGQKMQQTGHVVLCFFGDGAANQGTFHESLNMAAIWNLPILYVCENNRYAMSMRVEDSMAVETVAERAGAYGMRGHRVDGMDCEAVFATVGDLLPGIRCGGGPALLEADCYRFCGHSKSDRLVYRSREEEEEWRQRDPLLTQWRHLLNSGVSERELEELDAAVSRAVDRAYDTARNAPAADSDQVLASPYAEDGGR
jgi:pyruvate dehydrogenase E1 component alpha subunit